MTSHESKRRVLMWRASKTNMLSIQVTRHILAGLCVHDFPESSPRAYSGGVLWASLSVDHKAYYVL